MGHIGITNILVCLFQKQTNPFYVLLISMLVDYYHWSPLAKKIKVTLYIKVSLLQCNYTFKYWVILINYMYLL